MNNLVKIGNENISIVEWKGQRVITTALLAEVFETSVDNVKMNFNRHKDNFVEGIHYFLLQGEDLRAFKNLVTDSYLVDKRTPQLYLWTERGASRHCKILDTDKAWEQFDNLEETYFKVKKEVTSGIEQGFFAVKFIADDLRVSESSRLFMYENYCKDVGIPTGFLPKYIDNGNREQYSATELLNRNGCEIKTAKFNQLLIAAGYMDLRERTSSKGTIKKYKALTDKGLQYGVNLISNKNQKECQPYYYADTFMELYNTVYYRQK